MSAVHLFVKQHGEMIAADRLCFSAQGIAGSKPASPLRHVLITELSILRRLGLEPGELRENIVADVENLHNYPSGTVIRVGEARIRLTFHCEPCRRVASGALLKTLHHQRGVLGKFLNAGEIRRGDTLSFEPPSFEVIPYEPHDRVRWYLAKRRAPIAACDLLHAVGLSSCYARALPGYLRRISPRAADKVIFRSSVSGRRQEKSPRVL
jgi:hypothetical protein